MSRFTSNEIYMMIGIFWGLIVFMAFDWLWEKYERRKLFKNKKPPTDPPLKEQESVDPFLENHLRNILLKIKFGEGPNSVKGVSFEQNFAVIGSLPLDQIERFSDLLLKYKSDVDLLLKEKKEKAQNAAACKNPDIE